MSWTHLRWSAAKVSVLSDELYFSNHASGTRSAVSDTVKLSSVLLAWVGLMVGLTNAFSPWSARGQDPLVEVRPGENITDSSGHVWTTHAARQELRPQFFYKPASAGQGEAWLIRMDADTGQQGCWQSLRAVEGGVTYRFRARVDVGPMAFARRRVFPKLVWLDARGASVPCDDPVVGPYHPPGSPAEATPQWPMEQGIDEKGRIWFEGTYRAPSAARQVRLELHAQWAPRAAAYWSDVAFQPVPPRAARPVRLAAVHYRPRGQSPEENCREFAPLIAEAARQKADLVVLPETVTFYGTGRSYAECAEPIPGPATDYFSDLARQHKVHLVVGLLERDGSLVYNVAVLLDDQGRIVGKYRKVCLPRGESEAGITPGDSYPVFDTALGRIGMMICYDGFFPEVARRLTESGAEIIAFPVWGCNPLLVAARACENQVYIVSSTYTAIEQNWMVSGIFDHQGALLARAEKFGTVAVAEVDLSRPTYWANLGDFREEVHRHRPPSAYEYVRAYKSFTRMAVPPQDPLEPQWLPLAERRWTPMDRPTTVPQPNQEPPPPAERRSGSGQSQEQNPSNSPAPPQASPPPATLEQPTASTPHQLNLRIAPLEPQQALRSFHTQDGFRMELVAAEPLVVDPVAMEFDEFGRAYVLEMRDYPYTDKTTDVPFRDRTTDQPLGRVRLLEDRDGDGMFDTSTVFADELSWPTGLAVWKGGLYVAATPDLWYLKDTDGDGRADLRRRVFHGFRKFNVQAVINNLKWGLDHRIYGAGSSNGGKISSDAHPDSPPVEMSTHDFRFDPQRESLELLSGGGRFGLAFDDWGNRFICNIRNPIRHAVFPDEAMKRHPLLRYPPPVVDVAIAGDTIAVYRTSPPEPWRVLNAERLAADRTAGSPRSESVAAGYMTSACGLTIYRGSAYPPRFYGQAFLGEVAGNLIHRQQLEPRGVTFAAHRIDERSEFVTSDDNWFRPVNFANAPDGTMYVLDMYRETIEHPWSIPDDLKEHLDLESGRDRGRIYRLAPPGFQYRAPLWPGNTSTEELVRLLGHPNGWHRDTAHRLLFERQDTAAIEPLRKWIRGQTMAETPYLSAVAVVLALWSLEGLNALEVEDLASAFEHSDEHVREHAIRLAAGRMDEPVLELIRRALRDVSPRVRFQAWLAVAAYPQNVRRTLLLHGLESLEEDLWLQTAWLSATQGLERELLEAWLSHLPTADPAMPPLHTVVTLAETLAEVVTVTSKPQDLDPLWQRLPLPYAAGHAAPLVESILSGILEGARRRGMRIEQWTHSPAAQSVWRQWTEYEVEVVCDQQSPLARRTRAMRIAAQAPWEKIRPWMEKLFNALEPPQLQLAAVRAAIEHANEGGIDTLLEHYRRLSPAVRTECISLLVGRSDSAYRLLTAIQQGKISTAELTPTHCALLMRSSREDVKSLARQLLSENQTQRADVVQQYRNALSGRGDPRAGETVFRRVCANCHRVRDIGTDVGPPLETVLHRSKYELLLHILDPNREVMPQYQEYIAVLADGRITTGILMEESPTTVCLRRAGGHQENLARSDLAELTATGKSLMPEGLEREITPAQMDDLLSFLLDATPGNR